MTLYFYSWFTVVGGTTRAHCARQADRSHEQRAGQLHPAHASAAGQFTGSLVLWVRRTVLYEDIGHFRDT